MAELAVLPALSGALPGAGPAPTAPAASGGPAFGAVLRDSLAPAGAGTLSDGAAASGGDKPKDGPEASSSMSAGLIAAVAAPGLTMPAQPFSVAASAVDGGSAGVSRPSPFPGNTMALPAASSQDLIPGPFTGSAPGAPTASAPAPVAIVRGVPTVELPIAERGVTTGTPVQAVAPAGAAPVAEAAGGVLTDTPAIAAAPEAMGETAPDTRAEVAGAESAAPPAFDPPVHLTAEAGDTQAAEQAGSVESAAGAASEEGDAGDAETDDAHARAPQTAALASAAAAYQSASVAATGRAADLTAAGTRAAVAAPHPAQPAAPSDVQAATGGAPIAGRVVDQVANGLAMHVREGRTEATLTLRPEALGEVRVHIVAGPAGLTIRLSAEREAVTELLRASAGELHAALAGRQVPVSELHVLYNAPPAAPPRTEQAFWQERPWSRREQAQGDGDGSPPRKQSGENDEE